MYDKSIYPFERNEHKTMQLLTTIFKMGYKKKALGDNYVSVHCSKVCVSDDYKLCTVEGTFLNIPFLSHLSHVEYIT